MAPRRGGGGSSFGSSASASCPHPFSTDGYYGYYTTRIEVFVAYCLLWVALLGLIVARSKVVKKLPGATILIGPLFLGSVWSAFFATSLMIVGTMLLECSTTPPLTYMYWVLVFNIFYSLSLYLLLVLVFYTVNKALHQHLNNTPGYLRIVNYVVLGFMGILTVALTGLWSYNYYAASEAGRIESAPLLSEEANKLDIAYFVFYLVTVSAGGVLAIMSLVSMRSRKIPTGNLFAQIIGLYVSMFIWVLINLIEDGTYLPDVDNFSRDVYIAFTYIRYIFWVASWSLLLSIAASPVFKSSVVDNVEPNPYAPQPYYPVQQQGQPQFAAPQNGGQQYYYQQHPIHTNGAPIPAPGNGNGHVVQVK
ncbi:hypothetical protein BU24DRAFT_468868 [Aaosphaeria arxii CBS 175.79]|uniref:Uncharacterized protein n=1 Tax=Aaosphaeria arxii CBS 175.79 TaxID=1450172 RepID=A0A6A5X6C2_9PLEO|nr:uncharacterized protein BU24DRAFT_468868 [Aaosphaeria arxii CBS 175.79]KAF2008450.1 hypothetical protein BU24DRAFT_468868 [Aaosphaeria arxii CBS 175.79]